MQQLQHIERNNQEDKRGHMENRCTNKKPRGENFIKLFNAFIDRIIEIESNRANSYQIWEIKYTRKE